jgi:polysaccharide export outer membrane protein
MQLAIRKTVILISLFLLAACSGVGQLPSATYDVNAPKYVIGPGDTVNIFVWGNTELSSSVPVRPDGMITTPLVEDVQASGKTSTELAREMERHLSRYIKNPIVTVYVTKFVGRFQEQIRVIGEAVEPQSIPFKENMTVLDVMIAVGGLTEFAAGNSTTLVRTAGGKQRKYRLRLDDLIKDGDIAANVDILPGDILIIPEAWF